MVDIDIDIDIDININLNIDSIEKMIHHWSFNSKAPYRSNTRDRS